MVEVLVEGVIVERFAGTDRRGEYILATAERRRGLE